MSSVVRFSCEAIGCGLPAPGTTEEFDERRRDGKKWLCPACLAAAGAALAQSVDVMAAGARDLGASVNETEARLAQGSGGSTTLPFIAVKDSGQRQEFDTGSVRDTQEGKPRLDLIPTQWLTRLGSHLANGAVKYGDNNWQRGQPITRYYGSAMRHLVAFRENKRDEDHAAAAAWNILAAMWTEQEVQEGRLPAELDDRGLGAVWKPETVARMMEPEPVVRPQSHTCKYGECLCPREAPCLGCTFWTRQSYD